MEIGILEKKVRLTALYDLYQGLLTEKQSEVLHHYCDLDESISEIAEQFGVSRQAIHETIRKLEKTLERHESKLGVYRRIRGYETTLSQVGAVAESESMPDTLREAIRKLLEPYDI